MRIIVTGGLGFIGSNFVNLLNERLPKIEVVILDKMTYAADPNSIIKNNKLIKKDICDVTPEDLGVYDYIVHFAAESHVDNSISDGRPFMNTNIIGTFNLVECAKQNKSLKKFIHISTDEVYGDMADSEWLSSNEDHNLSPSSYYSSSKASSDMIVLSSHRTFGLPYLLTRTCNNYGENQNKEKFLPKIFDSIINEKTVPVYGDGKQIREWMYVKDNVEVIFDLMMDDKVVNEVYNIGTDNTFYNLELVKKISEIIGKDVTFEFVTDRLGHDRKYNLDCTKLKEYYKSKGKEYQPKDIIDWMNQFLLEEVV
jgi:dTDP-glucose 4,6-dehydratase